MAKIKTPSKKIIILTCLLLVLVITGGLLYRNNNSIDQAGDQSLTGQERINLDPPTEDEIKQASDNKQRIDAETERLKVQQQASQSSLRNVTPVISFAEQNGSTIEVGSYVPGIFEDGGNCTALITRGSNQLTRSQKGVKEGSNTFCPKFTFDRNEFPEGGNWSVKVTYESGYASGQSQAKNLEIK